MLVYLVKHTNFDLISCIASHASLGLCLMSSLTKGESVHKVGRTLLLTGWLREET
jgi:hypothetical protein